MNTQENKKKLTKEEKAELFAQMRAAAKGKEIFPESMAEARKFGELLKKGKFSPTLKW